MNRFIKIGADGLQLPDGAASWVAVKDTRLDLWWSVAETESMLQPKACEAAAALTIAGFTDWRLPTVDELFALADRARHTPAIDVALFPNCKPGWYWTSTRAAYSPAMCAWVVFFGDGGATFGDQGNLGFVRAVRATQ
jgi:hypothetical protein